ncbi:MAG: hypothetical protein M3441_06655 [Chloroflexota bacterium]|nr:hypothetical protein [Chloroflexota bacterium]
MVDFLRDPIWQLVGAITGLAAFLISALIGWQSRFRKALTYEIVSAAPFPTVEGTGLQPNSISVLFDGRPVTSTLYLIIMRIRNSGNVPIGSHDYAEPLLIRLEGTERVLTVQVAAVHPTNLSPKLAVNASEVTIQPLLLNPGDSFELKMLVEGYSGEATVEGRIQGLVAIEESAERVPPTLFVLSSTLLIFIVGLVIIGLISWLVFQDPISLIIAGIAIVVSLTTDFIISLRPNNLERGRGRRARR